MTHPVVKVLKHTGAAPVVLLLSLNLTLTACGPGVATGGAIKVVSDLPLTGSAKSESLTLENAIRQAFEEKNYKACNGRWTIQYEPHDDASAAAGDWDPEVVKDNAQKYVADESIVAVIGTLNSGAAAVMIPILNPASLVMISPANTAPGLTKPGKGEADEPDKYYPTGARNYTRVIPADDLQGAVGAQWAKDLGVQAVYLLDDRDLYGKSIADVFAETAKNIGLNVLGRESLDPTAAGYTDLAARLKTLQPDLIYFGGTTQSNAGQLVKDIRRAGYAGRLMGPDGIFEDAFIANAGAAAAEGIYVTFPGLPPDALTGKAAQWLAAYKAAYNDTPEVYAVYGYVATTVLLDAFERVCASGQSPADRKAVRQAVLATHDFDSILGKFSLDANGDTSLTTMSGSQVKNGKFEFVTLLGGQ